jgi:hypothetical protein
MHISQLVCTRLRRLTGLTLRVLTVTIILSDQAATIALVEPLGIDGAWSFTPQIHRDDRAVPVSIAPTPQPAPCGRCGLRSRRGRRVLIALVVLFILFCGTTARLFIWPTTGIHARVDAIVVPGGPGNRIAAAIALAEQEQARYLVLSKGEPVPPRLCGAHVGAATVLCFMPNPDTTQGEAQATARLAKEYGFRSITLVTTPDQTWRAELRFGRCYSGKIYAVTTPLPKQMWPLMIAYQWGQRLRPKL